jgi:hypothetical protein
MKPTTVENEEFVTIKILKDKTKGAIHENALQNGKTDKACQAGKFKLTMLEKLLK